MSCVDPPKRPIRLGVLVLIIVCVLASCCLGIFFWGRYPDDANRLDGILESVEEKPVESERMLRNAIGGNPAAMPDFAVALAWRLECRGEWRDAETLIDAIDLSKARSDLLLKSGNKALQSDQFQLAIRLLEPLRNRGAPETSTALQLLWKAYFSLGAQDQAIVAARESLGIQPNNYSLRLELIRALKAAYREVECLEEIRQAMQRAMPAEPQRELEFLLLDQLIVVGNVPEAWNQVESMKKRYGVSAQLQSKIIDLYRAEGRLDEALIAIDELFPLAKQLPVAYLTRGAILLDMRRHAEALGDLEKAVSMEPFNERSRFKLSEAYRGLGQVEQAKKHRDIGVTIRSKRIRIIALTKQYNSSTMTLTEFEEMSTLHRDLGDDQAARYWESLGRKSSQNIRR